MVHLHFFMRGALVHVLDHSKNMCMHLYTNNQHNAWWIQVVIRVRPPLPRELRGGLLRPYQCTIHVDPSGRIATISENLPAVLQVCRLVMTLAVFVVY